MACTSVTLNGIALDCGNVGGLKALYIADKLNVTAVTVANSEVTAFTTASAAPFKKFEFRRGNANLVSTGNRNDANGTNYVETVITATFNKMETAKRTEMQSVSSANTYVVAKDNNDTLWFVGYDSYVGSTANGNSGAQFADANNYQLTMTSQTAQLPYVVTGSAMTLFA